MREFGVVREFGVGREFGIETGRGPGFEIGMGCRPLGEGSAVTEDTLVTGLRRCFLIRVEGLVGWL